MSCQYHNQKDETISLVQGEAVIDYGIDAGGLTSQVFRPGDTIHLPPGVIHRVTAVTDVVFVEGSTASKGWRHDVVRISDAYGREGTQAP